MGMKAFVAVCVAVGFVGAMASVCGAAPSTANGFAVLSDQSLWRYHAAWRTPATVEGGKYHLGGGHPIPNPGTRWILNSLHRADSAARGGVDGRGLRRFRLAAPRRAAGRRIRLRLDDGDLPGLRRYAASAWPTRPGSVR